MISTGLFTVASSGVARNWCEVDTKIKENNLNKEDTNISCKFCHTITAELMSRNMRNTLLDRTTWSRMSKVYAAVK